MVDKRLIQYISLTLAGGFAREHIKIALRRANWPEEKIDEGFLAFDKLQKVNENKLIEYIEKTMTLGFSKEQIFKALLQAKWPKYEVEKTLLNFKSPAETRLPEAPKAKPQILAVSQKSSPNLEAKPEIKPLPAATKKLNLPVISPVAPKLTSGIPRIRQLLLPKPHLVQGMYLKLKTLLPQKPTEQKISAAAKTDEVKIVSETKSASSALGAAKAIVAYPALFIGFIFLGLFTILVSLTSIIIFSAKFIFQRIFAAPKALAKAFIKLIESVPKIIVYIWLGPKIIFIGLAKIIAIPFRLFGKIRSKRLKSMRFIDMIRLAGRMFKTRRLRTLLTILGISIGIGTILFLVSLGYGLQNMLLEQITSSDALLSIDVTSGGKQVIPLTKEALDKMKVLPFVVEVSPMATFPAQITMKDVGGRDVGANTIVNAVSPSFFRLAGIKAFAGEFFTDSNQNQIVVSQAVIKLFNLDSQSILGKEVLFTLFIPKPGGKEEETETIERNDKYKVVGVINDEESNFIYLPINTLSDLNINDYSLAKVKVEKDTYLEQTRTSIFNMGYSTSAISDTIAEAKKIFTIVQIVLSVFGVIALIVSAIGMFNTITIALLERTQEIGIMKSIGASNRDVWKLFLTESIIMGFMGGMGGLATSFIGSTLFNYGVNFLARSLGGQAVNLFQRPLWFIATIVVFSTLVGFIVGLWPARRAAKINPLEALRYK